MGGVENSKTSVCLKWRKEHVHTVVHGNLTAELLGPRSRLGALSSFSPANHWGKNRGLSEICKRKIICKSKKCPLLKWMRIFHIYSCLCPFAGGNQFFCQKANVSCLQTSSDALWLLRTRGGSGNSLKVWAAGLGDFLPEVLVQIFLSLVLLWRLSVCTRV